MAKPKSNLLNRFMLHTERITESGCWLWTASLNNKGYGRFVVDTSRGWELAHRVSWQLHSAPIPEGANVLHRCDIRCCVNPYHLFLGTIQDNAVDMVQKGRQKITSLPGERNPSAILNESQVREIRILKGTATLQAIGDRYGVSLHCIWRIFHGKIWKHVV